MLWGFKVAFVMRTLNRIGVGELKFTLHWENCRSPILTPVHQHHPE